VEFCPPYSEVAQIAVDARKPFLQYSLTVATDLTGKKVVTIVADHLRIDRATLGSLVRSAAAADASIGKIALHARRIEFVESIALNRGSLDIFAQEIEFASGSTIALLPDSSSQIRLMAEKVILSSTGFRHFDVRARTLEPGKRDDFSDIKTLLSIRARNLAAGATPISSDAASTEVAKRFTRYPITDFKKLVDIEIGDAGRAQWLKGTKDFGQWPSYTVAVLRSAFLVAPYDKRLGSQLLEELRALTPILESIDAGPLLFEARAISDSITRKIDLSGNGPAFATNRPLGDLLREISDYTAGKPKLANIDFAIAALKESVDGTPVAPDTLNRQVSALNEEIRLATIAYQNTNNELVGIQTSIAALAASLQSQRDAYSEREQRLKEYAEDLKKSAQNRAQIVSALSTAASIATTAYTGNPQTGAAVGGVVYAVGNATGGKSTIDSLSAGFQFAGAIQKPLESLSKTVGDFKESRSTYDKFIESFKIDNITIKQEIDVPIPDAKPGEAQTRKLKRDDALKQLAGQGTQLKDGVENLLKVYDDFKPGPVNVPAVLEEDETLKTKATEIASTLESVKQLTQRIEALQRIAQEQTVALVKSGERLAQLTNLPIENEARRRMLGSLAFEGARDELAKFSALVDMLRRVSIVEFRAPLPVDPEQIQNTLVMERISAGFDPTKTLDQVSVGKQYVELLERRRTHISLLANTVVSASDLQFREFVDNQGRAPYISYPTEEFIDSPGSPAAERQLIRQINETLREQFDARKDPSRLAKLQRRQLVLPFDIRSKIDQRYPARLLQLAVTDIRHSGQASGGDLVFRLEVERVGNLRKSSGQDNNGLTGANMQCFSVDLRPKKTPADAYFIPSEFTIAQVKSGTALSKSAAQSFWYLTTADSPPSTGRTMMVTYPPAEARMYLKVRLDPNTSWANAPQIEKLTVTAEIFQ
jgi:septal ring factor EnvC (AmiA/AmiB activator)